MAPDKQELLKSIEDEDTRWNDIEMYAYQNSEYKALKIFRLALEEDYACGLANGIEQERASI